MFTLLESIQSPIDRAKDNNVHENPPTSLQLITRVTTPPHLESHEHDATLHDTSNAVRIRHAHRPRFSQGSAVKDQDPSSLKSRRVGVLDIRICSLLFV